MTPERYRQAQEIFLATCERACATRPAFLDKACADDEELRSLVEALLAADAQSDGALASTDDDSTPGGSRPAIDGQVLTPQDALSTPDRIGAYVIRGVLGEGGMGIVYDAEQHNPRRRVALKVIRPGIASKHAVRRFEHEAQLLARLQHPGIAQIFEAGATQTRYGRQPFFAMELVQGEPITEYAKSARLGMRARLELLMKVCRAVEHAHQHGVIHRDLKPANILVVDATDTEGDEGAGSKTNGQVGQPKVLDFGVARAVDADLETTTLRTEIGQLIGTVPYMSPEQIRGDSRQLTIRSDVYALGVLAYELLTDCLPYALAGKTLVEAARIISEESPKRPSSIDRRLGGELETVVLRALDKDPSCRYASAESFAEDINRILSNRPILADPPSLVYRVRKFVRRNRIGVIAGSVIVLVLLGATGISIDFALSEAAQRRVAEQREREAKVARDQIATVVDFQSSMLSGINAEEMGRRIIPGLRESIEKHLADQGASHDRIAAALTSFDELLAGVNATDTASSLIDKSILARAADTIESEFRDQPLVAADLRMTISNTYRALGLNAEALTYIQQVLAARQEILGGDHPETLRAIAQLGLTLQEMGRYNAAFDHMLEALEGCRRVLGDEDPDTLNMIGGVGKVLMSLGAYSEASAYLREGLEGRRRVLGDDHPDTLTTISVMGAALRAMGKHAEAEPYYREALEGRRRVLGPDHESTLTSMHNMGVFIYSSTGRISEALPYQYEALEGSRRVLGNDHPRTLTSIQNIGTLLAYSHRPDEAEVFFREALEGRRRVLGDLHPHTLSSLDKMGGLLRRPGRLEEAEALGAEAVEGARKSLPSDHWRTGVFLRNHGMTLMQLQRYPAAEARLTEAFTILESQFGVEHQDTTDTVELLIDLYSSWHEAEPDAGHDVQAAEWWAKLPQRLQTLVDKPE